jgi:hypothetical protein
LHRSRIPLLFVFLSLFRLKVGLRGGCCRSKVTIEVETGQPAIVLSSHGQIRAEEWLIQKTISRALIAVTQIHSSNFEVTSLPTYLEVEVLKTDGDLRKRE